MANYRINELPDLLKEYFKQTYAHFWGSIYLYAPKFRSNRDRLRLKFDGIYLIDAGNGKTITINGHIFQSQETVFLKSDNYTYSSNGAFRLRLVPENILQILDRRYQIERAFYPKVYTY